MTITVLVVGFFGLLFIGAPVAVALGAATILTSLLFNPIPPEIVGQKVLDNVDHFTLMAVPFFFLAASLMETGGLVRRLVSLANSFVGHLRGGLGMTAVLSCMLFAAISGSSPATVAAVGRVMYPSLVQEGYSPRYSIGALATAGSLGILIPPSIPMILYGFVTETSISRLFIAGILPGLLAVSMYILTVAVIGKLRPGFLPAGVRAGAPERMKAIRGVWAPVLLFVFVIGGLYGGLFTPTEAGGMGAGGAFLIGVLRGRLDRADIRSSLLQATRTAAAVFTVLIGALLFGYFLTITQTPQKVTEFLTGLGVGRYGVLALIMLMYLVLGCLMDAMAMIILTVPIIFPVIKSLGFDPIWFGVIIVMTVELGLIHPPVGMNVFVIKSVVKDVKFSTIFVGVLPFILTDLIRLVILIAFPIIALYLPTRM